MVWLLPRPRNATFASFSGNPPGSQWKAALPCASAWCRTSQARARKSVSMTQPRSRAGCGLPSRATRAPGTNVTWSGVAEKSRASNSSAEHDPEKWAPGFLRDKRVTRLRGDHAQTINQSATAIRHELSHSEVQTHSYDIGFATNSANPLRLPSSFSQRSRCGCFGRVMPSTPSQRRA